MFVSAYIDNNYLGGKGNGIRNHGVGYPRAKIYMNPPYPPRRMENHLQHQLPTLGHVPKYLTALSANITALSKQSNTPGTDNTIMQKFSIVSWNIQFVTAIKSS